MEDYIEGEGLMAYISRTNAVTSETHKTKWTEEELNEALFNTPEPAKNRPILGQMGAGTLLSMNDSAFAAFYNSDIEILASIDSLKEINKRAKKLKL